MTALLDQIGPEGLFFATTDPAMQAVQRRALLGSARLRRAKPARETGHKILDAQPMTGNLTRTDTATPETAPARKNAVIAVMALTGIFVHLGIRYGIHPH